MKGIGNISTDIIEGIGNLFSTLWDFLTNIWEGIKNIPSAILDGLKNLLQWLFIPDADFFENKITDFKNKLNEKTHYQYYLDSLKEIESITDLTGDTDNITTHVDLKNYKLNDKLTINMNKFIDFSIFNDYKSTWYSWIRVVIYIALAIYNINQVIKMFNGFSAVEGSASVALNVSSKGSGKN